MSPVKGNNKKSGKFNREMVLTRAVAMADKDGLQNLSMRTLASELNVGVMSLYYYVANKDDLFDGMVETVAQEIIALPEQLNGEWNTAIRAIAIHAHHVLLRHPWVNILWSNREPGTAKLAYYESIIRLFREAGFSVAQACRGFHAVTEHVVGFTLQKIDFPYDENEIPEAARNFLKQLPESEFPYFAEHVQHHLDATEADNHFVFMLDLILDGLERSMGDE